MGGRGGRLSAKEVRLSPRILAFTTAPLTGTLAYHYAVQGKATKESDVKLAPNGATAIVTPKGKIKSIVFGDQNGEKYKSLHADSHSHGKAGKQHTHVGYTHDEFGTRKWSKAERRLYYIMKRHR